MADSSLCGHSTPNGPCTMPKGHPAQFHRHRIYETQLYYRIANEAGEVLSSGNGKVPLSYAITDALKMHKNIVIEVESGKTE